MNPVGYLLNHRDGLQGSQGIAFDYVVAGNGLFVQSESALLRARIRIAPASIRGLEKVNEKVELVNGLLPSDLFDSILRLMKLAAPMELLATVIWNGFGYEVKLPDQKISRGSVQYTRPANVVLDIHSHAGMSAFFSSTDTADEQGFHLYGVVGKIRDGRPELNLRVGVYGYFAQVSWPELFKGPAPAVKFIGEFGERYEIPSD